MSDLAFVVAAYGAAGAAVVIYTVSLVRRARQAQERREALERQRARLTHAADHAASRLTEVRRPGPVR